MALVERAYGEDLVPRVALVVEGNDVTGDISRLISTVEFESAVDLSDELRISVINQGFGFTSGDLPPDLVSHKVFQPGNEVDVFMGYGGEASLKFIGRAILARHLPQFPADGVPMLEILGHDKAFFLMNMEGEITGGAETRVRAAVEDPTNEKKEDSGQVYVEKQHHEIVREIAKKWGLHPNIDPITSAKTFEPGEGLVQPKGMSDYEFLRILATLNNFEFWIDWDRDLRRWVCNWKRIPERYNIKPELVFKYNEGDESTLLEIELDYGIRDTITDVHVLAWSEDYHSWVSTVLVENAMGPDPKWRKGTGRASRRTQAEGTEDPEEGAGASEEVLMDAITSSTKFRMAAGGVSIDVIAGRPFGGLAEAANWATEWFRQRKDHFVMARGKTVGCELLQKRQVHELQGLGPRLSGAYYFHAVRHKMDLGGGLAYETEFIANKVLV